MNRETDFGEQGAVAIVVAVMLVALLGLGAIVVDAGALYSHRRQIQSAADAAALAGVIALPGDAVEARSVADEFALANSSEVDFREYLIESTYVANDTFTANLEDTSMGLFFARFLDRDTAPVGATATAIIGSPSAYGSGLMPFGIIADGSNQPPYGYEPGGIIPLVVDNGSQSQGNWHYVDLTPYTDGANNTKQVIENGGTTDPVSIGTIIDTQTGSPNNPNFNAIEDYFQLTCDPHGIEELVYDEERGVYEPTHKSDGTHCNRLITCPVIVIVGNDPYDWDSVTGNSAVQIVGFLNMFVSNDPDFKDGELLAEFVQVVPVDAFAPGGYVEYGGVVTWLAR